MESSIAEYKDGRFEFMAADVRNGLNDTSKLYIKYADIEDKLEAYLHYNAKLRRRRLRMAGKRIIRIWRQRKVTKEMERKVEEEEKNRELKAHLKMVEEEQARVRQAAEKKSVADMRSEVQKRLERHEKENTFVCPRRECCGKTFRSKELFQLHERLHFNEDKKANAIRARKQKEAEERLGKEKEFLEKVKADRKARLKREAAEREEEERAKLEDGLGLGFGVEGGDDESSVTSALNEEGDGDGQDEQSQAQMDVEEFFRVTSPSHYTHHMQHFEDRPTSPSVPKLFLDFGGSTESQDTRRPMSLAEMLEEENSRLKQAEEKGGALGGIFPQVDSASASVDGGPMYNDDISLTSSITDDFDFMSDQDFLSSRSAVTGVELDEAIAELEVRRREIKDNFSR